MLGGLYAKATPYPCEVQHKTLNRAGAAHGRIGYHQRGNSGRVDVDLSPVRIDKPCEFRAVLDPALHLHFRCGQIV